MLPKQSKTDVIQDSREALTSYLEALFREPTEADTTTISDVSPEEHKTTQNEIQTFTEENAPPSNEFDILIVKISGLSMAMKLADIDGIIKMPESITQLPKPKPWLMGLAYRTESNVQLVDIAKLIVPDKYRSQAGENTPDVNMTEDHRRVVLIDDGRWGLVCNSTSRVMRISEDDVNWRDDTRKRPWLAGTIREHLCALMDVKEFSQWLDKGAEQK